MTKPLVAVVVSDLHCGSDVGLSPPEVEMESGNVVGHGKNIHQAWLWQQWQEGFERVKEILGSDAAVLIVNGDATEGVHHHNNAEIIAQEIETHVSMAHECLKPLADLCGQTIVVKGTECHTRNMENLLAERLNAVSGKARDKWLFTINGCLIDAAHHIGVTSRAYLEASGLSIAMGNARLNYLRCGHQVPKVFYRAHRHCGGYYSDGFGCIGITGAFQMLTRHGMKVVTDAIPRPSILVSDWRGKKPGELPTPHEIFFTPPQHEITEL